jgi:hypothetical protein
MWTANTAAAPLAMGLVIQNTFPLHEALISFDLNNFPRLKPDN